MVFVAGGPGQETRYNWGMENIVATAGIKEEISIKKINLFDLKASVGVEVSSGIINDLDGLNEGLFELFDYFLEEEGGFEEISNVTTYEEGCREVIEYFQDYCLNDDNEHELDELKDLLVTLKEKTNNQKVTWVLWGVESDVALGFIE